MSVSFLKTIPRELRFAPRVDGKSLKLQSVIGEADEATINDVALVDARVVAWDGTANKRLTDTNVTITEIGVLSGVTPGTALASKALILNTVKDISGIRILNCDSINANTSLASSKNVYVGEDLGVTGLTVLRGDIYLQGTLKNNVVLNTDIALQVKFAGVDYNAVSREGADIVIGNISNNLILDTATLGNFIHRRGSVDYRIWDESNMGSGGGLDADKLDGQHGSYFLNASNFNAGVIPFARLPVGVSANTVAAGNDNRLGAQDILDANAVNYASSMISDSSLHDLDLSAKVPANRLAIIYYDINIPNNNGGGFLLKKKGDTIRVLSILGSSVNYVTQLTGIALVFTDGASKISYSIGSGNSAVTFTIVGFI